MGRSRLECFREWSPAVSRCDVALIAELLGDSLVSQFLGGCEPGDRRSEGVPGHFQQVRSLAEDLDDGDFGWCEAANATLNRPGHEPGGRRGSRGPSGNRDRVDCWHLCGQAEMCGRGQASRSCAGSGHGECDLIGPGQRHPKTSAGPLPVQAPPYTDDLSRTGQTGQFTFDRAARSRHLTGRDERPRRSGLDLLAYELRRTHES